MLTNYQSIKANRALKESYFGRKWSTTTALEKNSKRVDYTFEENDNTNPARQLQEQILTSYQNRPNEEIRNFVSRLRCDSLSFLAVRRGIHMKQMQRLANLNESMVSLVRRLFDLLEAYSMELNSSVGCSELQTSITRPVHVREITKYSRSRHPLETVTYFRARLASPSWGVVARGKDDTIEFFLIPVETLMGLSRTEVSYTPICKLNATIDEEDLSEVQWFLGEKELTPATEENISMDLFTALIEQTKIQLEEDGRLDSRYY